MDGTICTGRLMVVKLFLLRLSFSVSRAADFGDDGVEGAVDAGEVIVVVAAAAAAAAVDFDAVRRRFMIGVGELVSEESCTVPFFCIRCLIRRRRSSLRFIEFHLFLISFSARCGIRWAMADHLCNSRIESGNY